MLWPSKFTPKLWIPWFVWFCNADFKIIQIQNQGKSSIILLKSRSEISPVTVTFVEPLEIHSEIVDPNPIQARRELVANGGSDWQGEKELEAAA